MTSGLILTNAGAAEIEAAYQAGQVISIIEVALGDGGGEPVNADPTVTALVGQFGSVPFSYGESNTDMISGQIVIPAREYAEKTLREVGLKSESGTLIAYGAYPDTWIPGQSDSIIKEIEISFAMPLVHAESVTLLVDPNVAILTIEEGDKRYYQQSLRLKEIADAGEEAQTSARDNLGLGTAATADTQTSKDDVTAGRALVNGGAIALRSTRASQTEGADVTSANDLPKNSVSFVYRDALNGPGITGSVLDFGGITGSYNTQIVAEYQNGGKVIMFRTFNGDAVQTWNPWYSIYHTGNKPTASDAGAFPASAAALTVNLNTLGATGSQGVYYQTLTANATAANGYPMQEAGTLLVTLSAYGCQQEYTGFQSSRKFVRGLSGPWNGSNGPWYAWKEILNTNVADTRYQAKGSYTPAGQAYTKAESDARYVQDVRLLGRTWIGNDGAVNAPAGCVFVGGGDFGSDDGNYAYAAVQKKVNGNWYTVAHN